MFRSSWNRLLDLAIVALLVLGTSPALAATVLTLDWGNSDLSGYPARYGTVEVTRLSDTEALITATADSNATNHFLLGAAACSA